MANAKSDTHLVVVGSSAGGIDALSILVSTLPENFPAPLVLAQHLEPTRPSHLAEILARRSRLPVRSVSEQEAMRPGTIYVVPSNHHVQISDGSIEVRQAADDHRPSPSVDRLLTTAAESFGERLIAVILSGTGSDGAAGAYAVKRAGGTVIIQDPNTASYPGMPLSLAPTTVDIVASIDRIGPILGDLLAGLPVPTRPDERRALETFLEEVRERYGIDFNSYKTPTILRRLQRRIVATDSGNLQGYVEYVRSHPSEYQQLINSFLIKVTEFFRDPDLFDALREKVLPDLITYARGHSSELRIWSAGCATGEEAYSLAILVSEVLGTALEHLNVRIFATDADAEAIAFARRGIYPASAVARLPEDLVKRYFTRDDGDFQIRKRVRALTVFGQHDLGQRAPFPGIDMVVCRNVLIYFTPELQQRTLKLFAFSLRNNGYLVLGKAESASQTAEFFELEDKQQKIYRRHGDRILIPPSRPGPPLPLQQQRLSLRVRPTAAAGLAPSQREQQRLRSTTDALLLRLPVGIVLVDRHYDIQAINSAARRFLSIHGPAIGEDVVHLSQGVPSQLLRSAIDQAFRDGVPTSVDEFAIEDLASGEQHYCQISCHPQRIEGEDKPIDAVMVVLYEITAQVRARRAAEQRLETTTDALAAARDQARDAAARRDQLVQRLVETNRQLLEANQELTSANEELRTTNEEFLVSNEEAQAAIEEVETLNEELQATNEELETLNEELQSTIEELNTTNDDLHARSMELQEMARVSEEERARLSAILGSLGDAVLVVDRDGRMVLTNAAYERLFGPAEQGFVARDEDGNPLPAEDTPQARAARGESFSMEFTVTTEQGERRWFEASGQPVAAAGSQQGSVLVIRDISERSLRRVSEQFLALASHELRTPLTPLTAALQALARSLQGAQGTDQQRRYAEIARAQVERLSRLVGDLLDATRLRSGKYTLDRQPLRLDELVARTVEAARLLDGERRPIELTMDGTPLTVEGDEARLEQIVWNLLNNAMAHAASSPRIEVRLRRAGAQAELHVRDYGPGIAPEDLPHLFTRFYQATRPATDRGRGLGLGLYISQEIARAHGGEITVQSQRGQGATFTLRLPLAGEERA